MTYRLSARSLGRMEGVHPDLRMVVELAITRTAVDFTVLEGVRSRERQERLLDSGATTTLNSRHLTGHAVDLGAWLDGGIRWDWPLYYQIAEAMAGAANTLAVPVRWGGCWGEINGVTDIEAAVAHYVTQRRAAGKRAFIDGPHFELPRSRYPATANVA